MIQGENGEEKKSEGRKTQPTWDSICRTPMPQAVMDAGLHHHNAGGRTEENLKIRLWMLFQEEMAAHPQKCHPREGWHCPAL